MNIPLAPPRSLIFCAELWMPTPAPTAWMVTCVPEGVAVRRCESKFQTTPSIVRVVPAAPDTQLQPPLVVALMFRGICADGATTRGAPVVTEGV